MDIVKNIKDYGNSARDVLFQEFLEETLDSVVCSEKVVDRNCILDNSKPLHDFVVSSNEPANVYAKRLNK